MSTRRHGETVRERLKELVETAELGSGADQSSEGSTVGVQQVFAAAQAAGFLEAVALVDQQLAAEMITEFETVGRAIRRLSGSTVAGFSSAAAEAERRARERRAESDRRGENRRRENLAVALERRHSIRRGAASRRAGERRTIAELSLVTS